MESLFSGIADKISDIFIGILISVYESLVSPFQDLRSLKTLIFGEEDDKMIWGVFTEAEYAGAFAPTYKLAFAIAGFILIISIVFAGMRIASSVANPSRRNELLEFTKEIILVMIALSFLPSLYQLLFTINSSFISLFRESVSGSIMGQRMSLSDLGVDVTSRNGISDAIGLLCVGLVHLGLSIWASFYYLMRTLTLLVLLGMGPAMVVCWLLPQWKGVTLTWLKETTGSIFVQSVHAFTYWICFVTTASTESIVMQVMVFVVFIPLAESIRNLIGMGGGMQSGLSKAGGMLGLSAVGAVAGAFKGALDGESVTSALKGFTKGAFKAVNKNANGDGQDGEVSGSDANATSFADTKAAKMLTAGEFWSKAGKATLGASGAIAGAPLGPLGSVAMAEMGSMVGGAVGGVAGRVTAATLMEGKERIKQGQESVQELKNAQKNNAEQEVMTNAIQSELAKGWAGNNRESMMKQLQQDFPNATPEELDKKFNDIVASKAGQFKKEASEVWDKARKVPSLNGSVNDADKAVDASANAMADQWANNNREAFNKDYEESNPRQTGETQGDYETRRSKAFKDKVSTMKNNFAKEGNVFVRDQEGEGNEINGAELAQFMASASSQHKGVGNVEGLEQAAIKGMTHASGVQLFDKKGAPDIQTIASSIATVKTAQDRQSFMQNMKDKGSTEQEAAEAWSKVEPETFNTYKGQYSSPSFNNDIAGKVKPLPDTKAAQLMQEVSAFGAGALGKEEMKAMLEVVGSGSKAGYQTFKTELATGNALSAVPNAIQNAVQGAVGQQIEQHGGDAVQAHSNFVNKAGYVAGVMFGQKGMEKGKAIASNISGYNNAMDYQISSPSEVIQMAQKTVDDNGREIISAGAIRQVITRDSSHIEVRTASGEVRTVSRMGAGSEDLKTGQVAYRDLTSEDGNSLYIAKVNGSNGSVYEVDSGGTRLASAVRTAQNPMNLLGSTSSAHHGNTQQMHNVPVLNQKVDDGSFYQEDLFKMDNPRLMVGKGQKYIVADRDGTSYRVSPIQTGDARISANETVEIPLELANGQMQPIKAEGEYGVKAKIHTKAQQIVKQKVQQNIVDSAGNAAVRDVVQVANVVRSPEGTQSSQKENVVKVQQDVRNIPIDSHGEKVIVNDTTYYDSGNLNLDSLLESKYKIRAKRSIGRRQQRDMYGKKQGGFNSF